MLNPFQCEYHFRLKEWKDLRISIRGEPLEKCCIKVDDWWQQAPIIPYHLHPLDQENWPDPWTMLSENNYCTLTRALGICYTLLLSDIYNVTLVQAKDNHGEEHNLVIVGSAKYILSYYPKTTLSNCLKDFTIQHTLSLDTIKQKIL